MSKKKFFVLLLGALFIVGADLQAADIITANPQAATTEPDGTGTEGQPPVEIDNGDQVVTQRDLQGLNSEVANLRDQLNRRLDRNIANTQRSIKIGGVLQNRYTAVTSSNQEQSSNGFTLNAAILSLTGALKKDYDEGRNLNYVFSVLGSAPTYNVQPLDVYLQYSILQSLDPEQATLNVQFGQQKKPFGLEPQVGEDKTPVANPARFAGPLGLDLASRDQGVQLRGDLWPHYDGGYNYRVPLVEYALGVFNGSGQNASDTNKSKDVVARVALNAPVDYSSDLRGLTIGGSLYSGKRDLALNGGTLPGGLGEASKIRWGGDISYVSSPIGFTAEYAYGRDESALSGTTLANAVKQEIKSLGYTVTLFYQWGEQFLKQARAQNVYDDWWPKTYQPFVRFDRFDPNTAIAGNETSIITYGFNLFFAETTKLQLNYNVLNVKTPGSVDAKTNQFVAQFQYGF
jgi:hypothetical protein